jgi:2-polyprenyl-3-methyl-5-hydroxy-6-metoxy-1,4-benzoquinol methylase
MQIDEITLALRTVVEWPIVRCKNCALVYTSIRIESADTKEIYHDHAYEFERSARADALVDGRPHGERVISQLTKHVPEGKLIDIGCASGELMRQAERLGWKAEGVELAPHLSDTARKRGLAVKTGTLEDAHYPDATFDAATLLDVIEHLEDPLATLAEIHRILRPGGVLVIETPNWNSVYRRILRRWWAALQPRLHLLYLDPQSASNMLKFASFQTLEVTTEIVALFSAEGRARGFGPSYFSHAGRQLIVRNLIRTRTEKSRIDDFFLRLRKSNGQTRPQVPDTTSTPAASQQSPANPIVLRFNRPLDRYFLKRQMGEQLRIVARKV